VNETSRAQLQTFSNRIGEAILAVTDLVEAEMKDPEAEAACIGQVRKLSAEYAALLAQFPEGEKATVDRSVGRRVVDLKRLAAKLPQMMWGTSTQMADDAPPEGGWPFLQKPSAVEDLGPAPLIRDLVKEVPSIRPGGEVEAWCGPCDGLRDHKIVAVVDGKPKSVLCQSCGARHGYRTTPARARKSAEDNKTAGKGKATRRELEARRREESLHALQKELVEAADVKPFSRHGRYRVGEILEHPEYGRGKIENVLKGSLLVRFRTGLKSVSTM
jgi:hypothetical protein